MTGRKCIGCKAEELRHYTHVFGPRCWHKLSPQMQSELIRTEKAWRTGRLSAAICQSVRDTAVKSLRESKAA